MKKCLKEEFDAALDYLESACALPELQYLLDMATDLLAVEQAQQLILQGAAQAEGEL